MKSKETSWGGVASWYDEYLDGADTYQAKVIWPNLKRILDIPKQTDNATTNHAQPMRLLDLACGQGYFSFLSAKEGAIVTGVDISKELIDVAKEKLEKLKKAPKLQATPKSESALQNRLHFDIAPANALDSISSQTQDVVICILALQNIKELDQTISECARVLKKGGRFVFVLNHPSFRVPQYSDWYFDTNKKIQSRIVWKYMQEESVAIDMTPGMKSGGKKTTYSFHRPLQLFVKLLSKHGFYIKRLEEWCSHKKTEAGPRKEAEDKARKEIPMFMCIEANLMGF